MTLSPAWNAPSSSSSSSSSATALWRSCGSETLLPFNWCNAFAIEYGFESEPDMTAHLIPCRIDSFALVFSLRSAPKTPAIDLQIMPWTVPSTKDAIPPATTSLLFSADCSALPKSVALAPPSAMSTIEALNLLQLIEPRLSRAGPAPARAEVVPLFRPGT